MATSLKHLCFLLLVLFTIKCCVNARSFSIDYDANTFLKDDKPFKYVSGSIHSYRVPKQLWADRLYKMWAAGLNAIETYVFWNEHEQKQGVYSFEGQYNIFEFFDIAQKIGLLVVLRPGPYICGEHEYGGLPWWLLQNGTDMVVPRSSEQNYMNAVRTWFSVLLPKVQKYLYQNGGPIISVQVENEYGAFYTCDNDYRNQLRDIFREHLGNDVVLFTTDGYPFPRIGCGVIKNVYSTIDFGIDKNVNATFELMRQYSPKGPLVNSEFYPGWLDFWGKPHEKRDTSLVIPPFRQILDLNASVNFYMFHGGTNYGLSAGAHPPYLVQPTSYDYDAPLNEAGDVTQKYLAIREQISKYFPVPQVPIPANTTKLALGKIKLEINVPLAPFIVLGCNSDAHIESDKPLSFEKLGQGYGVVLYYTQLDDPDVDGKVLSILGIRDRAYVQIGFTFIGVLDRVNGTELKINLKNNQDTILMIIVENTGRLCYGDNLLDSKGILSDVTLDGKVLTQWTQCLTDYLIPYFQQELDKRDHPLFNRKLEALKDPVDPIFFKAPAVYMAHLPPMPSNDFDTFLKLDYFKKGIVMLYNGTIGTNLGRYWPDAGPQLTLYTPGAFWSTTENNTIIVFDFEGSTCTNDLCYLEFIDYPIINSL